MRARNISLRLVLALLLLSIFAMTISTDAMAKKPWEKFKFGELGEISIPDYERHELANGMIVYLLEAHEWPLIEGQFIIRTGSAFEPASKVGLATVVGDALRTGGTASNGADALDEELERMGAFIESNIGPTSGSLSFSFMNNNSSRGIELVADVLRNPSFDAEKLDVTITAVRAGISRRNDDLNGIGAREIQKAVWGNDHPYARDMEYETIDAVSREDVLEFYEYFYHPNNMMLAVTGDFDSATMLQSLKDRFEDWPRVDNPIPGLPNEPSSKPRRVLVANKDDVTQARVLVGQVGMRADDPDYYAMSVANRIMGGGFGSRLFNEVRSNLGLAYNVGSRPGISFARPGTFQAFVGTKSETTEQALGAVLGEIDKMRDEQVTSVELNDAKEAILNSNVFNYVSARQVLNRKMNLDYLGYPADFLETYTEKVRAIDVVAVQDVMKRRINPDNFAIVAVGKTEEWDGDLTAFGPVEVLDITIPEPKGPEFPEATAESIEKGRGVMAAAAQVHGGAVLNSLKGLQRDISVGLSMGGMDMAASMKTFVSYPNRFYMSMTLPFGEILQVIDGDTAWMKTPQGIQDMPSADAADAKLQILADPFYLLGHFDSFQLQALEDEDVEGSNAHVILLWLDDEEWQKLYIDAASNKLVKVTSKGKHPMTQAPGIQETFLAAHKKVDGMLVPMNSYMLHDGEKVMSFEITKFVVNPKIDDAIFVKPAS